MTSIIPPKLKIGDEVRLLSPASTPTREGVAQSVKILESFGLKVSFGKHIFDRKLFLAGSDEDRLSDFNVALNDPDVRAIIATRGGKGAYRLIEGLDYDAMRRDPKPVVGFSEITNLHLAFLKECSVVGIHGSTFSGLIRSTLFSTDEILIRALEDEPTFSLTTHTLESVSGVLIGGNIDSIQTVAGWALPSLKDAILFVEGIGGGSGSPGGLGRLDRQLHHLINNFYFDGLLGIAIGQFTNYKELDDGGVLNVLQERLSPLNLPILGGLPLGHGANPATIPIGTPAILNPKDGYLRLEAGVR